MLKDFTDSVSDKQTGIHIHTSLNQFVKQKPLTILNYCLSFAGFVRHKRRKAKEKQSLTIVA